MGNANIMPAEDKLAQLISDMSSDEKIARLFELVDFNGDGTVDWEEVRHD